MIGPLGGRQAPGLHEERMKDIIRDEAYRDITVNEGDRRATIPMAQAVSFAALRSLSRLKIRSFGFE